MARPKKQPAERRTVSLSCRLTQAERLKIEQEAIRAGMSASDYIRKLLLSGKLIIRENRKLDYRTYDQLRRIGVNLNQLTRLANRTGKIPYELERVSAAVEALIVRELGSEGGGTSPAADGGKPSESDGASSAAKRGSAFGDQSDGDGP